MGAPGLTLQVLGPFAAQRDGEPLHLGGPRQRAVLACLLLARGHLVPVDALVDAVWGETPPANAAGALQAYVSHLRRALEPDRPARERSRTLVSEGPAYALRLDDDAVDAWRFERLLDAAGSAEAPERVRLLTEALGLWRGPALLEYADQDFARAAAARWSELRTVAREQLLAARLDLGEAALVIPEIDALLREDPLREERWRLLVLAQYRAHRQADALATLRRARATLADELGVDPGPALRALEAEVLAQSDRLEAPTRTPTPPATPASSRTPTPTHASAPAPSEDSRRPSTAVQPVLPDPPAQRPKVTPGDGTPIVDRDRELAALGRCVTDLLHGQAGAAVIEGPAGIGKSRLLAELCRQASEAGAIVIRARGSQLEREFGLGIVRQLFDAVVAQPEQRERWFTGAATAAGGVFDATDDVSHDGSDGLFGVLHGLYWLTVNLSAAGPLVVAVDDLQWADTGSLRFLGYLTRRLEGLPVLLVTTLRTGEPHDVEGLLTDITDDPLTVTVAPAPLSRSGVADLVRERLGDGADEPFIAACHSTTSGNPLLLRQLLRALESDRVRPDASHADTVRAIGSRAVSSMVIRRFGRMPEVNRGVARAVAVLGDGASLPLVATLAGLSEEETAQAVGALARAEVLRDDYPLGFVHPLVRDAVYGDLSLAERQLAHERAATALTRAGATSEQVAAHLLLVPSRGDARVVEVLRDAAARDLARGAPESSAAYLRRALAEPPGQDCEAHVLAALGEVETRFDGPAAVEHLRAAYDGLTDPAAKATAAIRLATTLVFAGAPGEATRFALRAVDALPAALVDQWQALVALARIGGFMHGLPPAAYALDDLPGGPPAVVGEGPGARALAATLAWETLLTGEQREEAMRLAEFALADGELQRVDAGLLWVVAAITLEMAGRDMMPFWDQAMADAYERGTLFAALSTYLWRGYTQWLRGDLLESYQSMVACTDQNHLYGAHEVGQSYTDAVMAVVLVARGELAEARRLLDGVKDRRRIGDGERLFHEASAELLIAEGRYAEALVELDAARRWTITGDSPIWHRDRALRVTALRLLGRLEEATALADEAVAVAERWGALVAVGVALRLRGDVASDQGRHQAASADLDRACDLLRDSGARLELARALQSWGRARAAATPDGVPDDEAAAALKEALDLAEQCGAAPLRREVAELLGRAGVTVDAEARDERTLTTTEQRISKLAADGLTEREIAQALFVTPRTVQLTLESVCRRLGVAHVGELRQVLTAG